MPSPGCVALYRDLKNKSAHPWITQENEEIRDYSCELESGVGVIVRIGEHNRVASDIYRWLESAPALRP
jgi:hypothetical protein